MSNKSIISYRYEKLCKNIPGYEDWCKNVNNRAVELNKKYRDNPKVMLEKLNILYDEVMKEQKELGFDKKIKEVLASN